MLKVVAVVVVVVVVVFVVVVVVVGHDLSLFGFVWLFLTLLHDAQVFEVPPRAGDKLAKVVWFAFGIV